MKKNLNGKENKQPPVWAQHFLAWYCRPGLLEDLEGDLNEYFDRNLKARGARYARLVYVLDVFKFFRLYTVRKPDFVNIFIHYIMIGSYLRTSRRNLVRNKLFSSINIIGLSVSMSVGLLVVAFLSDLYSYDDFHLKKDRIYRVVTKNEDDNQPAADFASTSLKGAEIIKQSYTGYEDITLLRPGFYKDAKISNEKIIPLSAWWADASFFRVFTFPMLAGDPANALREPNSLVLTEKTAKKLFGESDAFGQTIQFDSVTYTVTGIVKDIPNLSHLRFDALVSFASASGENWLSGEKNSWDHIYSNYAYLTLPEQGNPETLQIGLDKLSASENAKLKNRKISLSLQPLSKIPLGKHYFNEIGLSFPAAILWVFIGLAFVVIISACFNYTNLSIARSLRRSKEVGIRKIVGALRSHVLAQFIAESIIIALVALVFSFMLFLVLRKQLMSLDQFPENLVSLEISPKLFFILSGWLLLLA